MKRRLSSVCLLLAGAFVLSGCNNTGNARLDEVRSDPTPDLVTLSQRDVDIDNAMVVTFDENGRMLWQDLGRMWLVDRPSRLTRETIPRP